MILQWSRGCEAAEARAAASTRCCGCSFNGAAAAKPRKRGSWRCPPPCESTFNGAAAAKPRKRGFVGDLDRAGLPSMEPRLRSRGSRMRSKPSGAVRCLQWSRGCEAAEACRTGEGCRRHGTFNGAAAAKPRKLVVEQGSLSGIRPSMEPRLRSRGSPDKAIASIPATRPSMEPRLRSRGSSVTTSIFSVGISLQWSRGCEAAEARSLPRRT